MSIHKANINKSTSIFELPENEPLQIAMDEDAIDMDAVGKVSLQISYRVVFKDDPRNSMSSYKDIEDLTNPEKVSELFARQVAELIHDMPTIATLVVKLAAERAEQLAILERAFTNPTVN